VNRPPSAESRVPAVPDHWQVLGLQPGADATALKQAFRQQARRWHPDLNGNDPVAEERFKLVNEAYAVLSDPLRRRAWEGGDDGADHSEPTDADPFASGFPTFSSYLDAVFGRRRSAGPSRDDEPPLDQNFEATPDQEPVPVGGVTTTAPPPPPPVRALAATESLVALSPDQALVGERVEVALDDGTIVEVWTPPLAGDGWRLRLAGLAPGGFDHFLQLQVRTAEGLRIDGLRVLYQLELAPADAALGCQVAVPTLEGPVRLRVPPGSSSGRMLRLRGRGLARGAQVGDQLVEIRVVVPASLSEAEQALYGRLRELELEQQAAAESA